MSQRKMLYEEAESSYADILFTHILCEKVFPENDGVVKEAEIRVGGKRFRVDLVTRYGQPERYFGIEVKYWPGAFHQGFQQADKVKNAFHSVFLGIPAEDVPVAQEERHRGRFTDIGILPISRIFPTTVAAIKATPNVNPDANSINKLVQLFDSIMYGENYTQRHYQNIEKAIFRTLTKRRKLTFLTLFLSQTKIYSLQKFLSQQKVHDFGTKFGNTLNVAIKHPDWGAWELYHLGVAEYIRIGVRKNFFRLHPWLIAALKNSIESHFQNDIQKLQNTINQIRQGIINKRSGITHNYIS